MEEASFPCPNCKEQVKDPQFAAFRENSQKMNMIINEMRLQNPELDELVRSTEKNDNHSLQRVEFLDKGGVMTYMEGYDEPYEGFPFAEIVDRIDILKKMSRSFLSGMFHTFRGKIRLIFLLPVLLVSWDLIYVVVYTYHRYVERFAIKPERYSPAVREVYRCFSLDRDESERDKDFRLKLRDLICMLLEFDNAYRYRFQDIVIELDQKEDIVKEMLRLLKIVKSREKHQEIASTWQLVEIGVKWGLKFNKKLRRLLEDISKNLILENVQMSKSAKLFSSKREDYNFGFMEKSKK